MTYPQRHRNRTQPVPTRRTIRPRRAIPALERRPARLRHGDRSPMDRRWRRLLVPERDRREDPATGGSIRAGTRCGRRSTTSGSPPRSAGRLSAPMDPDRLDLQDLTFQRDPERVSFTTGDRSWTYDPGNDTCTPADPPPAEQPRGRAVARRPMGGVRPRPQPVAARQFRTGTERQLTRDGEPGYGYGATLPSPLASAGLADPDPPVVHWSPDSRRFLSCRIDERAREAPPPRPVGPERRHHPPSPALLRLPAARRYRAAADRSLVLRGR